VSTDEPTRGARRGGSRRRPPADATRRDARHGDRARHGADARAAAARADVVLPEITYPEDLPVSARRADIAAAIRDHQVVVVSGETGSGKTTQIPKIALELGRGRAGQIAHTQPRRIAARSVAERIADELGTPLGAAVGYQVRFTDTSSDATLVKVMTDGILLAQIQRDPMLRRYDTIIVDEAHERSLNIDFILGYLTRLLPQRPDLRLIVTSATIDSARFAAHFAGPDGVPAPVVEVTGRTYPVEIRYRPLSPDVAPAAPSASTTAAAPAGKRKPKAAGRPEATGGTRGEERDLVTAIVEAVDEVMAVGPGDVLVFLSGEREIRDAEEGLRGAFGPRVTDPRHPRAVELVPLYSRLSAAEQHRVFEPHSARRVILATNVAETSLTVPGVRYVVDPGTARISRYSRATKVQRLPIEPISRASADQRSGRSGRLAPGVAIRLYSADDYASRPQYTEPEILRTSLASVILQMVAVGVVRSPDEVADFPFVDQPDVRAVRDGVALLVELGALAVPTATTGRGDDESAGGGAAGRGQTRLTDVGRALAQLPIDPRLARMLVEGGRQGVAREVVVIAAALSIQDPRERPADQREQADALHRRFADPSSDLLTYLNLWRWLRDQRHALSGSALRRLLRSQHLNYLRIREWQDVVTQLRDLCRPLGIDASGPPRPVGAAAPDDEADALTEQTRWEWDGDAVHRALLAGLLSQIGMQEATEVGAPRGRAAATGRTAGPAGRPRPRNEYLGARGARFAIFPGSALARRPPAWVMGAELVETSRLWARDVARIRPEWAEELAAHLVRRTYSEPAWSTRQGAAMVVEKVLLYGVPIVTDRRVLLGSVDPAQARELFIRHALVDGEWTTHHAFFHENRRLLAEVAELEARSRRRGLLADDEVLFDFYDERVSDDVVSARHFDTWWKTARRADPDLLTFTRELLVAPGADEISEGAFPSRWPSGDLSLPLTYQFEPGTEADGVTVHIPLVALARLAPEGFDWMVPGLRAELVTATIRALPKPVRVQLVPAPDVARAVDAWMGEHLASWPDTVRAADAAPSFHESFAAAVLAVRDVRVPPDAFDDERLPPHLRMTFRVVGDRGGVLDESKDLVALQRRLAGATQDAVSSAVRTAVRAAMDEARAAAAGGGGTGATDRSAVTRTGVPPAGAGDRPGTGSPRSAGVGAPAALPGSASSAGASYERTGLTTWPDDLPGGRLPEVVEATGSGGLVRGYPTLVDEATARGGAGAGSGVAVRVLADEALVASSYARGLHRLLLTDIGLSAGRVTSRWTGQQALALAATPYPSTSALVSDVQLAAIERLVGRHLGARRPDEVRDGAAYAALRAAVRDGLEDEVHRVVGDLVVVSTAWREALAAVRSSSSLALVGAARDVRAQVDALVHDGFVAQTGADRLPQLTRYLRAATARLVKAAENPHRDDALAAQVREVAAAYDEARARAATARPDPVRDEALTAVRWQLEELRVSLFAQQLGTPVPVSPTRIRKALAAIR